MTEKMTLSSISPFTNSNEEETILSIHPSNHYHQHQHPYLHQDHHHHQMRTNMTIEVIDSPESSTLLHSPSSSSISFSNSTQSVTPPLTPIDSQHQISLPEIVHHSIDHSPTSSWFQPQLILSKTHNLSTKSTILPLHIHQSIHHQPHSSKEEDLLQHPQLKSRSSTIIKSTQHQNLSSSILISRVLILIGLSVSSFLVIAYLVTTIPGLQLPTSLSQVSNQIHDLRQYSQSSPSQALHLLLIICLILIWKQTFSIPGTVFSNVLIGSLYGTFYSTLLTSFLTAVGSTLAYSLAIIARPLIYRYFPNAIKSVKNSLDCFRKTHSNQYDQFELISYLLLARLIPILPYSALNLTSGAIGLPVLPFFLTLFFGSLPYNFLTTQVGHLIGIATRNHHQHLSIWNSDLLFKLVFISLLSCLPILFKNRLKSSILRFKRFSRSHLGL